MAEYIWDFGSLSEEDYRKYTKEMLKKKRKSYTPMNDKALEMASSMILACKIFYKKEESASSVSLRDIERFKVLYSWFNKSLIDKRNQALNGKGISDIFKDNLSKYDNLRYP